MNLTFAKYIKSQWLNFYQGELRGQCEFFLHGHDSDDVRLDAGVDGGDNDGRLRVVEARQGVEVIGAAKMDSGSSRWGSLQMKKISTFEYLSKNITVASCRE